LNQAVIDLIWLFIPHFHDVDWMRFNPCEGGVVKCGCEYPCKKLIKTKASLGFEAGNFFGRKPCLGRI